MLQRLLFHGATWVSSSGCFYHHLAVSRRNLVASTMSSFIFLQASSDEVILAEPSAVFREHIDVFDAYMFLYPKNWIQVKGAGADIFFRDPFILDENISVEISSPSSSNYKSVEDLGTPQEAAEKVLKQYLTEFMSTRLGVRHESNILSTSSRVADDGNMYYQVERFYVSLNHTKEMSSFIVGLLDKLGEESRKLQSHSSLAHEAQAKSIDDFQKAYEGQSRFEAEKLIADVTSLVSSHMQRQKKLVDERLIGLRNAALENKTFMDEHSSSVEGVTTDAKRKWEEFSMQAQHGSKDGSDFSSVKHCRMELLLQQCMNTVDSASQQWKKIHASVSEMSSKQVTDTESVIRNAIESNEQHDAEVASVRNAAEEDVTRSSKDIVQHFERKLRLDTDDCRTVECSCWFII